MKTAYRPSSSSMIPGYSSNAVLQLIAICGVGYVAYLFMAVSFQAFGNYRFADAVALIKPNIALPPKEVFLKKWWTVLTYGWSHDGFWDWFSNMIWLYCFGVVVQSLVGYKQIIPLFFYGIVAGGISYMLLQLLPGKVFTVHNYYLGAQAGIVAIATAAITIAPRFRYFLGPSLSIPILLVGAVFLILILLRVNFQLPHIGLLTGGALTGFLYAKFLRKGYRPGEWIYDVGNSVESIVTPDENARRRKMRNRRNHISQNKVDELLDKINLHGYQALTKEEREILIRAGKEE